MSSEERRAPGMTRMPFEGLVEVGGALGPSFEAQAVNVSEDGMMLRTAYLPEPGQPLTCRFDAGGGQSVLASGEVVWTEGAEKGGEFAIRFTDMDPESVDVLKRLCGVSAAGQPVALSVGTGSKVRLHIEGLASPMRAKIRDAGTSAITVGSDLGFLQVGKALELEDAQSGAKRPACIDRVEVQIDPTSHVPQLVVTLRYGDAPSEAASHAAQAASASSASADGETARAADDLAAVEEAGAQMKGAVARHIARIGPAMERLAGRAKTTIALLAARRFAGKADDVAAPRRTTAPAPGGGLHTAGKRVVRGEVSGSIDVPMPTPRMRMTKRNAAIGGAVMITAILGAIALKRTHHEAAPEPAAVAATETVGSPTTAVAAGQTPPVMPPSPFPPAFDPPPAATSPATAGPITEADDDTQEPSSSKTEHHKHTKVAPFGNGSVHHGNILRLKMDGPIEALEGAQQPTGFAVKIPGRKSLEAAGPLASRDSRIAAIKVSNDSAGAELTMAFKDGVPHYQVMARGDALVIALAPAGDLDKVADKDDKGGKSVKDEKGAHHHKAAHKH